MQTVTRPHMPGTPRPTFKSPRQQRRFSPFALIGMAVTLLIVLGAGIFFIARPRFGSHAAAVNMDCALTVPNNPLSAQGLSTPYQLTPLNAANGPCNEANAGQAAFVQAAALDPATGQISIYNPLVVDQGTQPAIAPVVPNLPANAIVALWFGFNGNTLTLQDANGSLMQGKCVNGADGTIFGQFAYCNAPAFFQAANNAIQAGKLQPPALGTATDGMTCPTVRDFGVVDQDQSDNVTTSYLVTGNGRIAQMNAANTAALKNAQPQINGSDNRLLSIAMDGALGCTSWKAPDLADPGQMVPALPLDELQAAAHQAAPIAVVPAGDPMVLNNKNADLNKINAYRIGVDQLPAANLNDANTNAYCQNLLNTGLPRIVLDAPLTIKAATGDPAVGNTLFTFLAQRFVNTFGADNLNCVQLLGKTDPLATTQDGNGVAISATLNGQAINTTQLMGTGTGTTGTGTGTTTTPNCNINGTAVKGCMGSTTINGQPCTLTFTNGTVNVVCQNTQGGTGTGTGAGNPNPNPNPLTFNNNGISNDHTQKEANFDSVGISYSAQALQNTGFTPGKMVTFNGVNFFWPSVDPGTADNVQAQGQNIPIKPVNGATRLAFLGASGFGPSVGIATLHYTDGTNQSFYLGFSDWTLNGGHSTPLNGNKIVATMPYRNLPAGNMQMQLPNIFYTDVALQQGKTLQSVTLPDHVSSGQLHVFAVATK